MKSDLSQYPRIILGYHGCDQSVADRVLAEGEHLEMSKNSYDWLGEGIYFWEYGQQRAYEWAKKNPKIKNPAVVGAVINLGNCFDLLDRKATRVLKELYPVFKEDFSSHPQNTKAHEDDPDYLLRHLDCAVMNWIMTRFDKRGDWRLNYHSVRGLFQEAAPVYEGSGIRELSHVQIAVRDTACILEYFEPSLSHE